MTQPLLPKPYTLLHNAFTEDQLLTYRKAVIEMCANKCESLYKHLNYDLDMQKHWPETKRTNKIYADAIRELLK